MSAKWSWFFGIATVVALVLSVLFFLLTESFTAREGIDLLIGVVVGASITAFIATFLWHRKPASPATAAVRAAELKKEIDNMEQELITADGEVRQLQADRMMNTMLTTIVASNKRASSGTQREKAKEERAIAQVRQLKENIAEAKKEKAALLAPDSLPIRAKAPKGHMKLPN